MKKRLFKSILLIMFVILMLSNNIVCYGVIDTSLSIDKSQANQFDDMGSKLISIIRVVGMIVSVGALMVIGIRYMLASVDEKAEMKKSLIYYCVGAVLVFAIVNIVSAIYEALK